MNLNTTVVAEESTKETLETKTTNSTTAKSIEKTEATQVKPSTIITKKEEDMEAALTTPSFTKIEGPADT